MSTHTHIHTAHICNSRIICTYDEKPKANESRGSDTGLEVIGCVCAMYWRQNPQAHTHTLWNLRTHQTSNRLALICTSSFHLFYRHYRYSFCRTAAVMVYQSFGQTKRITEKKTKCVSIYCLTLCKKNCEERRIVGWLTAGSQHRAKLIQNK